MQNKTKAISIGFGCTSIVNNIETYIENIDFQDELLKNYFSNETLEYFQKEIKQDISLTILYIKNYMKTPGKAMLTNFDIKLNVDTELEREDKYANLVLSKLSIHHIKIMDSYFNFPRTQKEKEMFTIFMYLYIIFPENFRELFRLIKLEQFDLITYFLTEDFEVNIMDKQFRYQIYFSKELKNEKQFLLLNQLGYIENPLITYVKYKNINNRGIRTTSNHEIFFSEYISIVYKDIDPEIELKDSVDGHFLNIQGECFINELVTLKFIYDQFEFPSEIK